MPRTRPTKKIDVIGNLDLKPEDAFGEYIESKNNDLSFVKPPDWNSAGDSAQLIYTRNQREHEVMLQLQNNMLENAKRQGVANENRMRRLYKMQTDLRRRFIELNSFMKDCSDKKAYAERILDEQGALHKELQGNVEHCKLSIDELTKFSDTLKATLNAYEPYEKVMQDIVAKSNIYDSIEDCMNRCDALMLAQKEIMQLDKDKLKEIEVLRTRIVHVTNQAAFTVLGLKNDLAHLERTYVQACSDCLQWERILKVAQNAVTQNELDKNNTLDGIRDIYQMLHRRNNGTLHAQRSNVERELNYIKSEVEILVGVLKEFKGKKDTEHTEIIKIKGIC